jgi:acyl-CoA dehydrogenase
MSFRAPVEEIAFTLKQAAGFKRTLDQGGYGDLTEDLVDAVLEQAGRFSTDVIAPLNRVGDARGATLQDGTVTMPPGWKEAYKAWVDAGWNSLAGPVDWGGQGLPHALNAACIEMWNAASMAFGLGPLLTMGAIEALAAHGSQTLKSLYLPKLVSGEWTGTMQLTEPQSGSDLSGLRTRAEPVGDGSYRIHGQKIFITYGEHPRISRAKYLNSRIGSRSL